MSASAKKLLALYRSTEGKLSDAKRLALVLCELDTLTISSDWPDKSDNVKNFKYEIGRTAERTEIRGKILDIAEFLSLHTDENK